MEGKRPDLVTPFRELRLEEVAVRKHIHTACLFVLALAPGASSAVTLTDPYLPRPCMQYSPLHTAHVCSMQYGTATAFAVARMLPPTSNALTNAAWRRTRSLVEEEEFFNHCKNAPTPAGQGCPRSMRRLDGRAC